MNKSDLQELFQQEYNRDNWYKLFSATFANFEQLANPADFQTTNKNIESLKQLGIITLNDDKKIAVFEVKVGEKTDLARNRVELNNTISAYIDQWNTHAAIGVFFKCSTGFQPVNNHRQDACATLDYRFTFAQRQTVWGKEGMEEIKTHSKRYTYVLGPNESAKTAAVRFASLAERKSITKMEDLIDAFSVEKLSKQFYNELSNWYFWAIKHVTFPSEPTLDDAHKKKVDHKDLIQEHNAKNVIRLLTRLLFVWFVKQRKLIPDELFDLDDLKDDILKEFSPYHEDEDSLFKDANRNSIYYKAIMQNLFFASLNCPITNSGKDKRSRGFRRDKNDFGVLFLMRYKKYFKNPDKFIDLMNSVVPFLNGGLFECLDIRGEAEKKEDRVYIDGFSDNLPKREKLVVPDFIFFGVDEKTDLTAEYGINNKATREASVKGLINILKAYNFTIVENTPIDEEVALDPELLGKVFENLLASYNPETKTTARKQTGSFYTPREIVDYMVDESLKASIANSVSEKLEKVSKEDIKVGLDILFAYTDTEPPFNEEETDAIINAVSDLKILDPACGSGAFPMGILHKLVFILEKLDPDNEKWKIIQKEKVMQETDKAYNMGDKEERNQRLDEIKEAFDFNTSNYGRKLFLVENCIYGVDIQPIATQISKLRFFISLVVDQNVDNVGQASSLLESDRQDACPTLFNFGVRPLPNLETKFVTANTLIGIEKGEASLFDNKKVKELENELKDIRHRLFSSKSPSHKRELRDKDKELRTQIADKLEADGLGNKSAKQLAKWDPYDQNASSPFFDMDWMFGIKNGFDVVIGNPPYVQIQKFSGQQCQKEWQKENYETFSKTGDIYSLFYERGWQLLESKAHLCFITSNKWMRANYGKETRKFFIDNVNIKQLIDFGDAPVFESATTYTNVMIFAKEQQSNSSQVWDINSIYQKKSDLKNMLSTENKSMPIFSEDAFIILSAEKARIKNTIEKIGIPLKDWDVSINFGIKTGFNEAFIIPGEKKNKLIAKDAKNTEIIKPILRGRDIKKYSANFADLWLIDTHNSFKDKNNNKISSIDIDDYPIIKEHLDQYWEKLEARTDKGVTPYNLRNCAYHKEFEKEKIIWAEIVYDSAFYFDNSGFYPEATVFFMTGENLKYITALLNSKLLTFAFKNFYAGGDLRGDTFRYKKVFIEQLPIPKISSEQQRPFEILVDMILFAKSADMESESERIESIIDLMVFALYFGNEMREKNCCITDYLINSHGRVLKPFKDDDTDEFKCQYIEAFCKFTDQDKDVFRCLKFAHHLVKPIRIIYEK